MTYTTQTRLDSKPQGGWTREAVEREAARRGALRWSDLMDVLDVYYGQSFINPEIVAIQSAHETGWWTSAWYRDRLNLAGIGITGDPTQNNASKTWTNGTDAARAHMTHLALYAIGTTLPAGFPGSRADDPRWDAAIAAGYAGTKPTIGSLTNTWAIDSAYGDKLVAILNQRPATQTPAGDGTGGDGKDPTMATKPYLTEIPGIPGGPVPTIAPVKIKLIPEWRTLNRPGIAARSPRRSVQHGNGNPNSSAAGEANYLYNGAGGRQASYHSSTDDKETWIMVPGDEVTWQAADGAGPGNMNGFSNEMVEDAALWADPDRRDKVIANTADFMGTIAARLDIAIPEQHWTFNYMLPSNQRHDCPEKLRYVRIDGRLAWNLYEDGWYAARDAELLRMNGGEVPVAYETPSPIDVLTTAAKADIPPHSVYDPSSGVTFFYVGDMVEVVAQTPRHRWASDDSASVGPDLMPGERFSVDWVFTAGDGAVWFYTPWATRVKGSDVKRIGDAKSAA